jgi:aryl-alcohol dehydrogenase-like predicted oxidoreductase
MLLEAGGSLVDFAPQSTDPGFMRDAVVDPGLRPHAFVCVRTCAQPSRRELLGTLDHALATAGIGHADLWLIEGWTPESPWQEIASALAIASTSGQAMYVGLCPDLAWQAAIVGAALSMNADRPNLAALATPYSLLDAEAASETADVARALGSSLLAAWPLAGGVLTGKYRHATPPDSRGASERHADRLDRYRRSWTRPVIEALCAAADGLGVAPGALALAWARDRPLVAGLIVGARTTHQWRSALDSVDVTLPPEIRQVLDEVATHAHDIDEDERGG